MKITFEILNPKQYALASRFCYFVIRNLKSDIMEELNLQSIQIRADLLLSASWVRWNTLPRNINANKLCQDIVNCLEVKQRKSVFTIELNKKKLMNNSRTTLEQVARFIDKGNEVVRGTYFLTNIMTRYQVKIYNYWKAYRMRSQTGLIAN